jgi:hypothetical protein
VTVRRESEADFTTAVIDLARLYGWRSLHIRPAQTARGWRTPVQGDGKGFPDLVLVRPPEIIFAELKTPRGRLSPEQGEWISSLAEVGIRLLRGRSPDFRPAFDVYVWTPDQWDELRERLAPRKLGVLAAAPTSERRGVWTTSTGRGGHTETPGESA